MTVNYNRAFWKTWYEKDIFQSLDVQTSALASEMVIRWPKHVVIESQIDQRYNSQAAPGIQKTVSRWNAAISYLFLAEEKAQIKLAAFDLSRSTSGLVGEPTCS